MRNLSKLAEDLLKYLVETDGAWENYCVQALFPRGNYVSNGDNSAYWQWEANAYGVSINRLGKEYNPTVEVSYNALTSQAYGELRAAGLADEKNSGYNDYFFYATK